MNAYQAGLMVRPTSQERVSCYRNGVNVGIVSGGFFQTELKALNTEIQQLAFALQSARSIDPTRYNTIKPISPEQEAWFNASWSPFLVGWTDFYEDYASGWKSIRFPIVTSRAEQMEDWRRRFIALRAAAEAVYPNSPEIHSLPIPTPPKEYPSFFDDISSTAKGLVLWILVVAGIVLAGFIVYQKFGH